MQPLQDLPRVHARAGAKLRHAPGLCEVRHVKHVPNGPPGGGQDRPNLPGMSQEGTKKANSFLYVSFHAKSSVYNSRRLIGDAICPFVNPSTQSTTSYS